MRYIVYGAGAVGGVIGARLQRAGIETTLVARGAHLAAIQRHGITLETVDGREQIRTGAAAGAAEIEWRYDDVVLLAVKGHQTDQALADLAVHVPPGTTVVSAQNGVANERRVLRLFEHTYAICVMQPCAHLEPGVVVQQCHPVPGILDVGRFPTGKDHTAAAIARDLTTAGFVSEPRDDIMAWKYRKLILNLANVVHACFAPGEAADELKRRCRAEGERALAAAGIAVVSEREDEERRGGLLQGRARPDAYGSSWQSIRRGTGDIEADWLNGEIVLLGRLYGAPTPANALVQRLTKEVARQRRMPRSLDAGAVLADLAALEG